jgi:hypothetical protein
VIHVSSRAGLFLGLLLAVSLPVQASDLNGPGRFCGYAPVIDLLEGESVTSLDGGIHSGSFRWDGSFGTLYVRGIGWASKPKGRVAVSSNARGVTRFKQSRIKSEYVIAIWNRNYGAAYFKSKRPMIEEQIAAIDRVYLFDEDGPQPDGCKLRTIFVWE